MEKYPANINPVITYRNVFYLRDANARAYRSLSTKLVKLRRTMVHFVTLKLSPGREYSFIYVI